MDAMTKAREALEEWLADNTSGFRAEEINAMTTCLAAYMADSGLISAIESKPAEPVIGSVTEQEINNLVGLAQHLADIDHWAAQAGARDLAALVKRLLNASALTSHPSEQQLNSGASADTSGVKLHTSGAYGYAAEAPGGHVTFFKRYPHGCEQMGMRVVKLFAAEQEGAKA